MKPLIVLLLMLCSALLTAQDSTKVEKDVPTYIIHSAELCLGETLIFGNKSFKFKKIISDSRCPKGVTCIWAGEVEVLVEVFENGISSGEMIINKGNNSLAALFGLIDLKISKMLVEPYPHIDRKIKPEEYRVNLSISEKLYPD